MGENPTKLKDMSGGPEPNPAAASRLEQSMADLRDQYADWALRDIAEMEEALARAQSQPSGSARADDGRRIYEVAHNVKGQGRSFGYDLMTEIGASLCSLTRDREIFDDQYLAVIANHLKAMRIVIENGIAGTGGDVGEQLVQKLCAQSSELVGES